MKGEKLRYADLDDEDLVRELRERQREIKTLLTEIRQILKEAADV